MSDEQPRPEPETGTEPEPTTQQEPRRPGAGARVLSAIGRTTSALAVLGLSVAVIAVGLATPPPAPVPVDPVAVGVPAPTTTLVCPGPVRLPTEPEPGDDLAYDPEFDPAPGDSMAGLRALTVAPSGEGDEPREGVATGTLRGLTAGPDESLGALKPGTDAAVTGLDRLDRTVVVRAEPAGERPAWAAAVVDVDTEEGDLRGLVAASCQVPTTETWLVGGGTELGSSARLVLQNPGRTAASVTVEMWGPAGPIELAGAPEYLVPAGSERAVLLEGVAAEQRRIVVRLSASGGLVTAHLQDSRLRGLVPAGVDYVVAGRPPSTRQVVTTVSVTQTQPDGVDTALLRLLAPGEEGATARLTLLGPDGPVDLPGTDEIRLDPGAVLDVPLDGLPAGDYTAVVDADQPVVAGAMVTRGAGVGLPDGGTPSTRPLDRAWAPSVPLGGPGPLALPDGARGRLLVGVVGGSVLDGSDTSGPAEVTLEVLGREGAVLGERDLDLDPGTTTALSLADLLGGDAEPTTGVAGVVLRTTDPRVAWGVVLLETRPGGDLISVLAPVPPPTPQPTLGVRVR